MPDQKADVVHVLEMQPCGRFLPQSLALFLLVHPELWVTLRVILTGSVMVYFDPAPGKQAELRTRLIRDLYADTVSEDVNGKVICTWYVN